MSAEIEIRKIDGELDEIVADECSIHLEQLDIGHWWMSVAAGGKEYHVKLFTKRGAQIFARVEEQ